MRTKKTMPPDAEPKKQQKSICQLCNGSGQISSFLGVSRFLLSWEECPECGGLGYRLPGDDGSVPQPLSPPGKD
ncbi:MAG: hypothetical protein AB1545_13590 [Thermodesulfobacteriota bacterium]